MSEDRGVSPPEATVATDDDQPIDISINNTETSACTSSDVALLEIDNGISSPTVSLEEPPMPENEVSPSRSRRSRSRSRHRHRRSHWRNRFQIKKKESNLIAAACSMVVIVLLCTAMAEPQWFYLRGGGCSKQDHNVPVHYLGLNQFFYMGQFPHLAEHGDKAYTLYKYGPNVEDGLIDCVTPQSVQVIRSIIALCAMAVLFTILSFLIDLHGPSIRVLRSIQRHAVLSMFTVAVCVAIIGFCYWTSQNLQVLQVKTKPYVGNKVEVQFSVGFYLVAAAGGMAVITAACNLLRRPPPETDEHRERLFDDYDSFPQDSYGYGPFLAPPPPPPYAP